MRLPGRAEEAGKAFKVAFRQVAELPGVAGADGIVQLFQELQPGARDADLHDPAVVGPTVAVEFTPIKRWLELEIGVTPSFGRHSTEWTTDLLFKKPWDLTPKIEFMAGFGPAWVRTRSYGVSQHSVTGEAVLDFMFWASPKHRFGWYLEPAYDYSFAAGHERSAGIAIGILIGIR